MRPVPRPGRYLFTRLAAVVDQGGNFPSHHPLNQSLRGGAVLREADVILAPRGRGALGHLNNMRDQLHRTSNPNDLPPALARTVDVVRRGEPALVDVVTQPR